MPTNWTHNLPLKSTSAINFASGRLAAGGTNKDAQELLKELTRARTVLLELLSSFSNPPDAMMKATQEYLAAVQGLVQDPSSNLAKAVLFKWSDNLTGKIIENSDAGFEIANMLVNVGLWYSRHASVLAQTASTEDDIAKEIFKSLKISAGIFDYILSSEKQKAKYTPNTDLDERMLKVLSLQHVAEAQEVTVERARQKKHKADLIASLCADLVRRFSEALANLDSIDDKSVAGYRKYLEFKVAFYQAYGYCFSGNFYFSEEKCGQSIKLFQQAEEALSKAGQLAKAYSNMSTSKMAFHTSLGFSACDNPLFKSLAREIKVGKEKAMHENGFIYHQKIPSETAEMCAPQSLTNAEPFSAPSIHELWSKASFDQTKIPLKGQNVAADAASSDETPVVDSKGKKVTNSEESYCVVS